MSNLPVAFEFTGKTLRTVTKNSEPWFCLKDAASILEIKDHKDFPNSDWCDSDGVDSIPLIDSIGRPQRATFISEPNLYALIMRSRKKEAITFQRWITHDVIPSIRKTGSYSTAPALPSSYKEALLALVAAEDEKEQLALESARKTEVIQVMEPKAKFHDRVAEHVNCQNMNEVAKVLQTGEVRLWRFLKDQRVIFKEGRSNVPYQQFIERGYFKLKQGTYTDGNGEEHAYTQILVTGKGLIWLRQLWDHEAAVPA